MDEKSPQFVIKKILDVGVDHPLVNRVMLQFCDIADSGFINLDQEQKDEFKKVLWECTNDLLKAEESVTNYLTIEDAAIAKIASPDGVKHQAHAYSFEDPTLTLKKHFEEFLFRAVIAVRRTFKVASIVFKKEIRGPEDLKKELNRCLPSDSVHRNWIEEDSSWMRDLYDLRGKAEHQVLEMSDFSVLSIEGQKPKIKLPEIKNPSSLVRQYISVSLQNVFGYVEDMTALLLKQGCDPRAEIIQIPENERLAHKNFRYIVFLKQFLKKPGK
ncbi:MAG: hypothetical protein Q7J31_06845 [Syntrophales bacterium]|nr:hypothetical protein [Syntrophales bacterium]